VRLQEPGQRRRPGSDRGSGGHHVDWAEDLLPDAIRLPSGGARSRELSSGAVELSSKAVELSSEAAERRPVVAGAPLPWPREVDRDVGEWLKAH